MDLPDVRALQIRSAFAKPIRWTLVGRTISEGKARAAVRPWTFHPWHFLSSRIATVLINIWRLVPNPIRIRAYHGLAFLGERWYGPSNGNVQRLPFGLYVKGSRALWHQSLVSEYGALELVRRHTLITVPRPLDLVSDSERSNLLVSRVPDVHVGLCINLLSDDQADTLVRDLQDCVGELRAIRREAAQEHMITNAIGRACYDHWINMALNYGKDRGDFVGPFTDEDEFNKTPQCGALPGLSHRGGHRIFFTHSDVNIRNIMVHNGRLSGIVDWENSGWYPEYWEYTKAQFVTRFDRRWLRIVD